MNVDEWADRFAAECTARDLAAGVRDDPRLVTARTRLGDTLLHVACWHNRADLVDVLLAAGADVNARGDAGRRPLHCALHDAPLADALPIVERLLARHAVPELEDDAGFTVAESTAQEIWDDPDPILARLGAPPAPRPAIADVEASIRASERRGHTAVAIHRMLEAARAGTPVDVAAAMAGAPAADVRCLEDLARILTAIAGTTWSGALRELLAARFKPAHVHRLLAAYERSP